MTTRFKVADATCGHCKSTIESAITGLDGVDRVDLDLETKVVTVEHENNVSEELVRNAIATAGYSPERVA